MERRHVKRLEAVGPVRAVLPGVMMAAIALLGTASVGFAGGDGMALLERAAELTNPRSPGSPPSILKASVKLEGIVGSDTDGEYILKAKAPDMWWEMLRFGGWSEMHGVFQDREWRRRKTANKPVRMYQALHAADPGYHLGGGVIAEVLKVSSDKEDGRPVTCVKVERRDGREATLCFDDSSGLMTSAKYDDPKEFYEFDGQVELEGHLMPRAVRCVSGGEPAVEVTVRDWVLDEDVDLARYEPPEGADEWTHCADVTPPREAKIVTAKTPPGLKSRRIFGTVVGYAVINEHGAVQDVALVEMRHGVLMDLFRQIVAEWEYQPAMCGGTPVPFETVVSYSFKP